jgi:hypothetical protein
MKTLCFQKDLNSFIKNLPKKKIKHMQSVPKEKLFYKKYCIFCEKHDHIAIIEIFASNDLLQPVFFCNQNYQYVLNLEKRIILKNTFICFKIFRVIKKSL